MVIPGHVKNNVVVNMNIIHATFEAGVFHPVEPIALPEGCQVELQIVSEPKNNQTCKSPGQKSQVSTKDSIEDQIAELAAEIPSHEWQMLPEDLAVNLDHYLYGNHSE